MYAIRSYYANKYMLNIRFMKPETAGRARQCEADIEFELTLCNL